LAIERNQQRINEQIRVSPVRTIGADGQFLGILPVDEAISHARALNLDLVEVGPTERPPVCKIMDYGKFKYQQKKRQNKSHSHQTKLKEIRLRPKIGQHDVEFKAKHAREFLEHKDKVLVSVVFRGREMAHIDEGHKIVQQVIQMLEDIGKVEAQPSLQGKRIVCTIAPK
jgi:translation initiation factor IF-3